jgi:hypothetical protein
MVIAPPSMHPSGVRYRWRTGRGPGELDLADAPDWLRTVEPLPHEHRPSPPRTHGERQEFAQLWARVGVTLRPGDHNYLCPFHDDHHPSLHVDAEGCRWLCFGCRRGGGIGALRHELGERAPTRLRRLIGTRSPPTANPITLPGEIEVDVIGESRYQDTLLALTGGERAYAGVDVFTVAELELTHGTVEVRIDGLRVGRLDRETAEAYRATFEYIAREYATVTCEARILGGWDRGQDDVGAFGVRVLLPAFEDVPPSTSSPTEYDSHRHR